MFCPLIKRGNSGRPSAMPNYFGFYGRANVRTGIIGAHARALGPPLLSRSVVSLFLFVSAEG